MAGAISIQNLSFSYKEKDILKNISLDALRGELIMILGPNGAGKSTLVKCLLGLLSFRGNVWVFSQDVKALSAVAKAKASAYVPQNHVQIFPYRVLDVVVSARASFYGLSGPGSSDWRIARESLDLVGMGAFADRPYTELSGGELKLVLIARALTQRSPLVFLDEPTSSLDLKNRLLILKILRKLVRDGKTVLATEHDPNLAAHFATRLLMLRRGEIVAYGPPEAVVTREVMRQVYDIEVEIIKTGDKILICPRGVCLD